MTREVQGLINLFALAFGLIALSTAFWGVLQRDRLLAREDNPRRVLAELNIQRGEIWDRNGVVLAYSEAGEIGATRVYPYPEAVSAIGHYSYQYGVAGVEEAYDDWLSGENLRSWQTQITDDLLNRNRVGGDIQTTLDINLQGQLHQALQGHRGAGIIVHVPSGEIWAMVSLPAYDPNELDHIRLLLENDPDHIRLLNRVTAGKYQPGGVLQTLLMSTLLARGLPATTPASVADYQLGNLTLTCTFAEEIHTPQLPLTQAYRLGCPAPFLASLGDVLSPILVADTFNAAQLNQAAVLPGLLIPQVPHPDLNFTEENILAEVAGQGRLTLTPLHMAQVIAALLNDGTGVNLQVVSAQVYQSEWQTLHSSQTPKAFFQADIANQLKNILMERSFADDSPIFGHISTAYAGAGEYSWFVGWTPLGDGTEAVLVMVREGQDLKPATTAQLAVEVLRSLH